MDQLECKDANLWPVVNLRTIGGQIRHEKVSLKCIGLVFWVHMVETNLRGKSGAKRNQSKGENSAAPFREIQVILMPFQVHFKCSSCT